MEIRGQGPSTGDRGRVPLCNRGGIRGYRSLAPIDRPDRQATAPSPRETSRLPGSASSHRAVHVRPRRLCTIAPRSAWNGVRVAPKATASGCRGERIPRDRTHNPGRDCIHRSCYWLVVDRAGYRTGGGTGSGSVASRRQPIHSDALSPCGSIRRNRDRACIASGHWNSRDPISSIRRIHCTFLSLVDSVSKGGSCGRQRVLVGPPHRRSHLFWPGRRYRTDLPLADRELVLAGPIELQRPGEAVPEPLDVAWQRRGGATTPTVGW